MNLDSLSQELDRLYEFEISEYISRCDELKKSGFKIYRNEQGKHKVVVAGQNVRREDVRYDYEDSRKKPKKDNIFIRAKNSIKRGINNIRSMIRFTKFLYRNFKNVYDK